MPISLTFRRMIIDSFTPGVDTDKILDTQTNKHCLIRRYLGASERIAYATFHSILTKWKVSDLHLMNMLYLWLMRLHFFTGQSRLIQTI